MPNPVLGVVGASVGSSLLGNRAQSKAAGKAGDAQAYAAELATQERQRQFNVAQDLLAPYTWNGVSALSQQLTLLGQHGNDRQAAAIDQIKAGPQFTELVRQGEEGILANAAATGGLRGGDTQGALAQFRPSILNSLIEQQYQRLGGIAGAGRESAQALAGAALQTGQGIAGDITQSGAARAGTALAQGQAQANAFGSIGQAIGFGAGQFGITPGQPGGLPEGATLFGQWGF